MMSLLKRLFERVWYGKPRDYHDGRCPHGVYVGGCGIDWMCGICESDVTWAEYIRGERYQASVDWRAAYHARKGGIHFNKCKRHNLFYWANFRLCVWHLRRIAPTRMGECESWWEKLYYYIVRRLIRLKAKAWSYIPKKGDYWVKRRIEKLDREYYDEWGF